MRRQASCALPRLREGAPGSPSTGETTPRSRFARRGAHRVRHRFAFESRRMRPPHSLAHERVPAGARSAEPTLRVATRRRQRTGCRARTGSRADGRPSPPRAFHRRRPPCRWRATRSGEPTRRGSVASRSGVPAPAGHRRSAGRRGRRSKRRQHASEPGPPEVQSKRVFVVARREVGRSRAHVRPRLAGGLVDRRSAVEVARAA